MLEAGVRPVTGCPGEDAGGGARVAALPVDGGVGGGGAVAEGGRIGSGAGGAILPGAEETLGTEAEGFNRANLDESHGNHRERERVCTLERNQEGRWCGVLNDESSDEGNFGETSLFDSWKKEGTELVLLSLIALPYNNS
ncbi:hypothetical protein SAY87_032152 [Trapa incisa]|uniref:Uncharacterized protein n=1 Tax=Trapa incisa TaxID=236973 RepID=A0AAN7QQG6_9MYRT|nr:hypothetical protein SAY87_032152 [Trapa incisa]